MAGPGTSDTEHEAREDIAPRPDEDEPEATASEPDDAASDPEPGRDDAADMTEASETDGWAEPGSESRDGDTGDMAGQDSLDVASDEPEYREEPGPAAEAATETMAAATPAAGARTAGVVPPRDTGPAPRDPAPRRGGSGFVPLFLGGLVAAGLGFAAAHSERLQGIVPLPGSDRMDEMVNRLDSVAQTARANSEALAATPSDDALAAARQTAQAAADAVAGLQGDLDALSARIDELAAAPPAAVGDGGADPAALTALQERIAALEAQAESLASGDGAGASDAAVAAFRARAEDAVAEYTEALEQAAAAAEDRIAAAESALSGLEDNARTAARDLAVARVRTLAASGAPFAEALADLAEAGGTAPPDALNAAADQGVATLAELDRAWPDAARAALTASLREGLGDDADVTDRVGAFFRTYLGARSIEPRAGDDADAVLSRAGAAVGRGDIATALSELDALPAAGRNAPAMADWLARAGARQAALDALAGFGGDGAAQ